MSHALVVLVAASAALVAAPGCSTPTQPHRPPSGVGGCEHMFSIGDAGTGVGLDWDSAEHRYGSPVSVYVCEAHANGGTVRVAAPRGVSVSPATARVNAPALLQFRVLVARGARGRLNFTFFELDGTRFGNAREPAIVAGGDAWRFAASDG